MTTVGSSGSTLMRESFRSLIFNLNCSGPSKTSSSMTEMLPQRSPGSPGARSISRGKTKSAIKDQEELIFNGSTSLLVSCKGIKHVARKLCIGLFIICTMDSCVVVWLSRT